MSSISNSSLSNYLQSVISSALQGTGSTTQTSSSNSTSSVASLTDNQQLSPFAQLLSSLQKLQQSDPDKYKQLTQQIATNLESAATQAKAAGNTTAATQLSQLATDFTTASTSGQLPNIQDLAKAVGGHHHPHHHQSQATSTGSDDSSSTSSTSSTASQALSQSLASSQTTGSSSDPLNPMAIILGTLSQAGISTSGA